MASSARSASSGPHDRPTLWLIGIAFATVITGFVVTNAVELARLRSSQSTDQLLLDNMLTSIELVSRIARDLDRKRLAIDAHVLATSPQEMQVLEQRIDVLDADFKRAASAYEPLASLQGEAELWHSFEAQVAALGPPFARVLERSRVNRDAEARQEMNGMEAQFEALNVSADRLVQLNRDAAYEAGARVIREQRRSMWLLGGITLIGVLLAALTALWVMMVVRRRDAQLRRAWGALEGQNRELDAFAGRVAHELRGPLTAIDLSAQRLAAKQATEAGAFSVLRQGVSKMDELIEDLLALSRVGAAAANGRCSMTDVAAELERDLTPLVQNANGVLQVHVEAAEVRCAQGLLRQLLWNVAENAVKYRRPDATLAIELNGQRAGSHYVLTVKDNGEGMTPDEAHSVFEPFFRGERLRSMPGSGLGLSIVKRIVDVCGGSIRLTSKVKQGTTFEITLALADGS